jgi:hypothetical protein
VQVAAREAADARITSLNQSMEKFKKQANTKLSDKTKMVNELTAQLKAKVGGLLAGGVPTQCAVYRSSKQSGNKGLLPGRPERQFQCQVLGY